MSVMDLTGTTWYFNSTLTWAPFTGIEFITLLDFEANGEYYRQLSIAGASGKEFAVSYRLLNNEFVSAYRNGWTSEEYRTITITGGTGATNADLIAWMEANATQVVPSYNVLVSYKGETIAAFSGTTKTLTTAGKYLEADIVVTDLSETVTLQDKSATPTQETQTITADAGYTGLGTVTVNPIPSNYGLITYNGSILTVS